MSDAPTTNETETLPEAWDDLLHGLRILAHVATNVISPLHCEHDELWVMADPQEFNDEELAHLEQLGFIPDDDCFKSYRFGSA